MLNSLSIGSVLDALIPISRFNKGEANKIFDEVKVSGCKIVVKNNVPACVLITPERYQEMLNLIEDQYLLSIAEERMKKEGETYSQSQVMQELGINRAEVDETEVDFE